MPGLCVQQLGEPDNKEVQVKKRIVFLTIILPAIGVHDGLHGQGQAQLHQGGMFTAGRPLTITKRI